MNVLTSIFKKNEPSAEEVRAALEELSRHESELRQRQSAIDERYRAAKLSGTGEELRQIQIDTENIQLEIAALPGRVAELLSMQEAAERREAPARAKQALKRLPAAIEAAEKCRADWLAAKQKLIEVAGEVSEAVVSARAGLLPCATTDEKTFEAIGRLLGWIPGFKNYDSSDHEHLAAISRLVARRSGFFDEGYDLSLQNAWRLAGFQFVDVSGAYHELPESERHALKDVLSFRKKAKG